jgi:hypothetical protein
MPPVAAAVAIVAAIGAVGVAVGVTTVAAVAVSVVATAASAGLQYLTAEKGAAAEATATVPQGAVPPANASRNLTVAQARPPRRLVLGPARVGGVLLFQDNDNPYLWTTVALSDGPITAVDKVYLGDLLIERNADGSVRPGLYFNRLLLEVGLGDASQTVSPLMSAAWPDIATAAWRQRGIARVVARMDWGSDAANHTALWSGSTSLSFAVRGVPVYDPRVGAQSPTDATTWQYSANGPLLVAHVLTRIWGTTLTADDIDWTLVAAAANDFDAVGYAVGGVMQADADLATQLDQLLRSFDGSIAFVDGKYGVYVDTARASVLTIVDDDIIEVGEYEHEPPPEALFDTISATYFDVDDDGLEKTTPAYSLGLGRETVTQLPFAASNRTAQIVARKSLLKSRAGRAVTITVSDVAAAIVPFADAVTITSDAAPWLDAKYEVLQVDFTAEGVSLKLREYAAAKDDNPASYLIGIS